VQKGCSHLEKGKKELKNNRKKKGVTLSEGRKEKITFSSYLSFREGEWEQRMRKVKEACGYAWKDGASKSLEKKNRQKGPTNERAKKKSLYPLFLKIEMEKRK